MARLPDISDLGPTPQPDATRPIGTYDVSGYARGAQALAEGGRQVGAGLQTAAEGFGELSLDQSRWDYAKAHATLVSNLATQNAATAADTNLGPDDAGETLTERHGNNVAQIQDNAAAMVRDPRMRQRFLDETAPLITESNLRAQAHARALDDNASIAYVEQQGDATIDQAIAAPDDATRQQLIDSHNQLVDGLVAKGALTQVQAVAAKQQWAHQYATADALHRADTDPEGVIDELRAAPGSNDAITNRILENEGPGKAKTSSAVSGMTDSTWLALLKRERPDLAQGQSDQSLLALRADKGLVRDMTEANRSDNESYLTSHGVAATPGAQYLAHFLGPAGATAVLQADPNAPVADVLAKAVGPDKAQQMVDANRSVLGGQLAGSVVQWSNQKMGGAAPGGGSIYDMLRPDMREEVLAHAEAALQKRQTADRADFEMRVANATAEALTTGAPAQPLTRADFIGEFGAERGPVEFAKYDTQVQTGRAVAGMATMTPEQRDATVASLKPQPGDPQFALKAHAEDVAQQARNQLELQANKDPAGFAASTLPASKDAYAALSTTLANPTASADDRAQAAQIFASRALMEENKFGLPDDAQRILPAGYVETFKRAIATAANSDDAQARTGLIARVQQEAAMWGPYWPQVMRELAPQTQPMVRAIAAGADPVAMTRLLSLSKDENPAKLLKEQSETKANDLTKAVDTAMAPFLGTLVGRQRDRDYTGYYDMATKLGALYVRDGMSASDAAQKAFTDLIGGRYDFRDTYRIPKSAGVDADAVQAGAQAARLSLGDFDVSPAVDDIGIGAGNAEDSFKKFGRDGRWVTAPDQSGLNLAYGDKFVRTNDGKPLLLPWAKLTELGGDVRAREAAEASTPPQLLGILGTSLQGPMTLTANMGQHANWQRFQAEARPSTNVEDVRGQPKSFKQRVDEAVDSATSEITDPLFK